jgi:hypothetical protein
MKVSLDSVHTMIQFLEKDGFPKETVYAVVEDNQMNSFFVAIGLLLPRTQFSVAAIHPSRARKNYWHDSSLLT